MSYQVSITKLDTGETRISTQNLDWGDYSAWWWTEGNMGCDCNRSWEFSRAKKGEDLEEDPPCSYGRYFCKEAILPDGTRIVLDRPPESNQANPAPKTAVAAAK